MDKGEFEGFGARRRAPISTGRTDRGVLLSEVIRRRQGGGVLDVRDLDSVVQDALCREEGTLTRFGISAPEQKEWTVAIANGRVPDGYGGNLKAFEIKFLQILAENRDPNKQKRSKSLPSRARRRLREIQLGEKSV